MYHNCPWQFCRNLLTSSCWLGPKFLIVGKYVSFYLIVPHLKGVNQLTQHSSDPTQHGYNGSVLHRLQCWTTLLGHQYKFSQITRFEEGLIKSYLSWLQSYVSLVHDVVSYICDLRHSLLRDLSSCKYVFGDWVTISVDTKFHWSNPRRILVSLTPIAQHCSGTNNKKIVEDYTGHAIIGGG